MADITLYDRATLDSVYRFTQPPITPFWLQFFGREITFETPEIMFDRVFEDNRALAPFVLPNIKGRPQTLTGYDTLRFRPAYLKIKDPVSGEMHVERVPGETPITGSLSNWDRRALIIANLLEKARVKVRNRFEWMAAKAAITGQVVVEGEDYPSVTVDFRRDASLTTVLTGANRWNQDGVDPFVSMVASRTQSNFLSGSYVKRFIFGANAWNSFTKRVDLKELMNRDYNGTGQNTQVSLVRTGLVGQEFMGFIEGPQGQGRMEFWVDTSQYIDPTSGTLAYFLDQDTVVGIDSTFEGVQCFGAIQDATAQYKAMRLFFKNWIEQDPSIEYLLTQSAPLMVPKNPNTTFSIKVQ